MNMKKQKLRPKVWIVSILLLCVAAGHVINGIRTENFQWIWIILCVLAAAIYPIAEKSLTQTEMPQADRTQSKGPTQGIEPTSGNEKTHLDRRELKPDELDVEEVVSEELITK